MKKTMTILFVLCIILWGCEKKGENKMSGNSVIEGTKVGIDDISDFYYTYENINYNAFYQRYRFFIKDGKYMFFHETRERKNDYGPCEEEDAIRKGEFELNEKQWSDFYDLIKEGKANKRNESVEDGDSGPWMFIYSDKLVKEGYEYHFASYDARCKFEDFCASLAD